MTAITRRCLRQRARTREPHPRDRALASGPCAQLLILAVDDDPIRLQLYGLDSEFPTALTVIGVLDVVRACPAMTVTLRNGRRVRSTRPSRR